MAFFQTMPLTPNPAPIALGSRPDSAIALFEGSCPCKFRLHLFERLFQRLFLHLQLLDGDLEIVRTLAGSLSEGRVCEVIRIGNTGLLFFDDDLALQILRHPFKFRHHHLQLLQLTTFFVHLKLFQAN
jgi:hypothetical protein